MTSPNIFLTYYTYNTLNKKNSSFLKYLKYFEVFEVSFLIGIFIEKIRCILFIQNLQE
jgi:hypothetical protein